MISDEVDIQWLKEVAGTKKVGGDMKPLPSHMKERLLELGWVEERLGNLRVTPKGRAVLPRNFIFGQVS